MALLGYRKAGTDDTRCLNHVDFADGTPVYTAFECTYCGDDWAKGKCVPAEVASGEVVTLHADGCEHVEVEDTRPMKGAFYDSRMHGWVMIHDGNYYGTYMGGSEAGARAALRNARKVWARRGHRATFLSPAQYEVIKRRLRNGEDYQAVALEFGVAVSSLRSRYPRNSL